MNSLQIIKKELMNQKQLLEKNGFVVTTSNINPTPTEITTALTNLNFDFTVTTATEADVKSGKTFFSQTNEIKTGTFDLSIVDDLTDKIRSMVSGKGNMEIIIPENTTHIRKYAFHTDYSGTDDSIVFSKENMVIPESVTRINERAFYYSNLTGILTIPNTCKHIGVQAFAGTKITELDLHGGLIGGSNYAFAYCPRLKKARIYDGVTTLSYYLFRECPILEEVSIPSTVTSYSTTLLYSCPKIKYIIFTGSTPCSFASSSSFSEHKTALLIVPYLSFDTYANTSNFLAQGNPMCGFGEFEQYDTLPSSMEGYTLVWYSNLDDFQAGTNPITTCPETGRMYAACTAIETETTTE